MIRHLLLDLDNTLYPASGEMDRGISRRMLDFVAAWLAVPMEEAVRMRAKDLPLYASTLEWLKARHGLRDDEGYFAAVHPEHEIDELKSDPALKPYLLSLGLPITLLTNAPMSHARRVLEFFGIEDIFLGVFDLTFHGGRGKPYRECFIKTLDAVGRSIEETLFVDDYPKYVRGYRDIGGRAVLVDESGEREGIARDEGFGYIRSIYGLSDILPNY